MKISLANPHVDQVTLRDLMSLFLRQALDRLGGTVESCQQFIRHQFCFIGTGVSVNCWVALHQGSFEKRFTLH